DLVELCKDVLPFALSSNYCSLVIQRLELEEEIIESRVYRKAYNSIAELILTELSSHNLLLEYDNDRNKIKNDIIEVIKEIISKNRPKVPKKRLIFDLSKNDREKIRNWLKRDLIKISRKAKNVNKEIIRLYSKRTVIQKELKKVPEESILNPLLIKLDENNSSIVELRDKIRICNEDLAKFNLDRKERERMLDKYYLELEGQKKSLNIQSNIRKVIEALEEFSFKLSEKRLAEFKNFFLETFKLLLSERTFIEDIEVKKGDFTVSLLYERDKEFLKTELSEGEKQLYAFTLLWALAKTSRRELPFIIDTPLARLDSKNRKELINNFFTKASHQMIMFSTDEEVDEAFFNELSPYISRVYYLDKNYKKSVTNIKEGYFWSNKKKKVAMESEL
ncbi:MAG: hypothetical protein ACTSRU_17865, partial [Candidatus Hodarchaeales archaeon]